MRTAVDRPAANLTRARTLAYNRAHRMPLLQFGRYRDLATAVAERLQKEPVELDTLERGSE